MLAKRLYIENFKEIEKNSILDLKNPPKIEPKPVFSDFYFKIEAVSSCEVTADNYIHICLHGRDIFLKNEKQVLNKLISYLY